MSDQGCVGSGGSNDEKSHIMGTSWSSLRQDKDESRIAAAHSAYQRYINRAAESKLKQDPAPVHLVAEYFKRLSYPKIAAMSPVLMHALGDVYTVSFETPDKTTGTHSALARHAYAIVKDGVVSGYNHDFWTDADKYRLVLKQHLGMLAMEEAEDPKAAKVAEPPPKVSSEVKPQTVDAIVCRYEEIVAGLKEEIESRDRLVTVMTLSQRTFTDRIVAARDLLKKAEKALNGDIEPKQAGRAQTAEEMMIAQDSDLFGENPCIDVDNPYPDSSSANQKMVVPFGAFEKI